MKRVISIVLLLLLALVFIAPPAQPVFAQDPDGGITEVVEEETTPLIDWNAALDWLTLAGQLLLVFALLGYGTGATFEGVKDLLRWLTDNPLLYKLFPDGAKSAFLAFLFALLVSRGVADVGLLESLPAFQEMDEKLFNIVTASLIWLSETFFKKQGVLDYVYVAQKASTFNIASRKPFWSGWNVKR